ncbi:MAG TPA: hypothetical protein VMU89_11325 [Thermomicrobiaceae bacterium]|nr:hypothetical protein [Thermomicrobiaceae bacterium]
MRRRIDSRSTIYPRATPRARAAALTIDSTRHHPLPGTIHGAVFAAASAGLLLAALTVAATAGVAALATPLALVLSAIIGAGLTWAVLKRLDDAGHSV